MFNLRQITFDDVFPIWKNKLWPNRHTEIESTSCIQHTGYIDMHIRYVLDPTPFFFGVFNNDELIAVNSCHQTSQHYFRSRGIYIDPAFRKLGLSKMLFDACCKQTVLSGCTTLWSMPRKSALGAYLNFGFKIVRFEQDNYNEQNEPHYFVEINAENYCKNIQQNNVLF